MRTQILNTTLETQLKIVEAALIEGDNVIIAGNLSVGKTTLLKALHKKLNNNKEDSAVYFTMSTAEEEVEKTKKDIYTQYTDKILIIDELRALTSHGLRLDMVSSEVSLVASIQFTNSNDFNSVASELNLDKYFNKLVRLKDDGYLEVITLGNTVFEQKKKEQYINLGVIQMINENIIVHGDIGIGKTTLLKSLAQNWNSNGQTNAYYIDGEKKIEPEKIKLNIERSKGKILIIDEIHTLLEAGITFEQIDKSTQIIVAMNTSNLDYLSKKLIEVNPFIAFSKKIHIKNLNGEIEVAPILTETSDK